jgi:hypothetical protein
MSEFEKKVVDLLFEIRNAIERNNELLEDLKPKSDMETKVSGEEVAKVMTRSDLKAMRNFGR